jgi:hypothetical protein
MASHEDNLKRIEVIADGLGSLAGESIFIGGACTQFYVADPKLQDFRPTKDIDCIVKIYSYRDFAAFGEALRKLGFTNDTSEGAPIVRWVYKGIFVDIIPDESSVVGYRTIEWFKEGREHVEKRKLPSGKEINILPLAYYLATKLESWKDRGRGDFLSSADMEDIIGIVDGNDNLDQLLTAPAKVRKYVIKSLALLIDKEDFRRAVAGNIGFEVSASQRAKDVVEKIDWVVKKSQSWEGGKYANEL